MTQSNQKDAPWPAQQSKEHRFEALSQAIDLIYWCDMSRFADVFAPTVQLHGYQDGKMVMWTAEVYKDILDERESPSH